MLRARFTLRKFTASISCTLRHNNHLKLVVKLIYGIDLTIIIVAIVCVVYSCIVISWNVPQSTHMLIYSSILEHILSILCIILSNLICAILLS